MSTLAYDDLVQIIDNKGRRYSFRLGENQSFQNHHGNLDHGAIVGQNEGAVVESSKGQAFRVFRPTLEEFVIAMPRGAQIIYPKDIGAILMLADIGPGTKVFESGVGSGALSMGMLRAGATIYGLELREDFASRAKRNVATFLGAPALDNYEVELGDAYEGISRTNFDAAVLDLPEPWQVIPHLRSALRQGGLVVSYSPSITQVAKVDVVLKDNGFRDISVTEVLHRGWHVKGEAVRPEHRMVAHTGFLTRARLSVPLTDAD